MNKVCLIGRLTRDPELRFTPGSGHAVSTFSLAVDRNYVSQNGGKEADFINIISWRKLAEHVANNLSKGRLVGVSGRLQNRKYQAQDGSNRYVTEVVADEIKFLDWPKDKNTSQEDTTSTIGVSDDYFAPTDDMEIPF